MQIAVRKLLLSLSVLSIASSHRLQAGEHNRSRASFFESFVDSRSPTAAMIEDRLRAHYRRV